MVCWCLTMMLICCRRFPLPDCVALFIPHNSVTMVNIEIIPVMITVVVENLGICWRWPGASPHYHTIYSDAIVTLLTVTFWRPGDDTAGTIPAGGRSTPSTTIYCGTTLPHGFCLTFTAFTAVLDVATTVCVYVLVHTHLSLRLRIFTRTTRYAVPTIHTRFHTTYYTLPRYHTHTVVYLITYLRHLLQFTPGRYVPHTLDCWWFYLPGSTTAVSRTFLPDFPARVLLICWFVTERYCSFTCCVLRLRSVDLIFHVAIPADLFDTLFTHILPVRLLIYRWTWFYAVTCDLHIVDFDYIVSLRSTRSRAIPRFTAIRWSHLVMIYERCCSVAYTPTPTSHHYTTRLHTLVPRSRFVAYTHTFDLRSCDFVLLICCVWFLFYVPTRYCYGAIYRPFTVPTLLIRWPAYLTPRVVTDRCPYDDTDTSSRLYWFTTFHFGSCCLPDRLLPTIVVDSLPTRSISHSPTLRVQFPVGVTRYYVVITCSITLRCLRFPHVYYGVDFDFDRWSDRYVTDTFPRYYRWVTVLLFCWFLPIFPHTPLLLLFYIRYCLTFIYLIIPRGTHSHSPLLRLPVTYRYGIDTHPFYTTYILTVTVWLIGDGGYIYIPDLLTYLVLIPSRIRCCYSRSPHSLFPVTRYVDSFTIWFIHSHYIYIPTFLIPGGRFSYELRLLMIVVTRLLRWWHSDLRYIETLLLVLFGQWYDIVDICCCSPMTNLFAIGILAFCWWYSFITYTFIVFTCYIYTLLHFVTGVVVDCCWSPYDWFDDYRRLICWWHLRLLLIVTLLLTSVPTLILDCEEFPQW